MRASRYLTRWAATRRQVARMNEMARVVRAELDAESHGFSHRDTESVIERAWQNEPAELHIGFRA